jgi:hypothetical protein
MKEDRTMIFFPNQTIVHPDDVRERVKQEFRRHARPDEPRDVIEQRSWDVVDQASWDSFPASDAPPWTLGYIGPLLRPVEASATESDVVSR